MSTDSDRLKKLLDILTRLDNEAFEREGMYANEHNLHREWSDGVYYAIDAIKDELRIVDDDLTGELRFHI